MAKKKQNTDALKDLIVRLGQDPELLQAYAQAPRAVMLGAGVPKDQVETVLTGSQKDVKSLLGDDHLGVQIITTPKC